MTTGRMRARIAGLLTIGVLSSATMLWMFWHYPVGTGIATLVVLSALGISARLSRWIDTDCIPELKRSKQGV
jgi:hypothetical protein